VGAADHVRAVAGLARGVGVDDGQSRQRIMSEDRPRAPPPSRTSKWRRAAGMVGGGMGVQLPVRSSPSLKLGLVMDFDNHPSAYLNDPVAMSNLISPLTENEPKPN